MLLERGRRPKRKPHTGNKPRLGRVGCFTVRPFRECVSHGAAGLLAPNARQYFAEAALGFLLIGCHRRVVLDAAFQTLPIEFELLI